MLYIKVYFRYTFFASTIVNAFISLCWAFYCYFVFKCTVTACKNIKEIIENISFLFGNSRMSEYTVSAYVEEHVFSNFLLVIVLCRFWVLIYRPRNKSENFVIFSLKTVRHLMTDHVSRLQQYFSKHRFCSRRRQNAKPWINIMKYWEKWETRQWSLMLMHWVHRTPFTVYLIANNYDDFHVINQLWKDTCSRL